MPLRKNNTTTFMKVLYAGELKSITLLKRDVDQKEGTVRALVLYSCRRSQLHKSGEPIQDDMTANHRAVWHIPNVELKRVGVTEINVLDRIVETVDDGGVNPLPHPRYWQPESYNTITRKLFENMTRIETVRVDPPNATTIAGTGE